MDTSSKDRIIYIGVLFSTLAGVNTRPFANSLLAAGRRSTREQLVPTLILRDLHTKLPETSRQEAYNHDFIQGTIHAFSHPER